jgi:phosphatidylglycerophosphate synthase
MAGEKTATPFYNYIESPLIDTLVPFIPRWITPNAITLFGSALALASLYAQLYHEAYGVAAVLYLLYLVADNADGKHARATGQCSDWGSFLDHAVDGLCSTPNVAFATARFLGMSSLPLLRLCCATFFGMHVVHAATGKLWLGASLYGADEIGVQVAVTLALESLGLRGVLQSVLGVSAATADAAFPLLVAASTAFQVSCLARGSSFGARTSYRTALVCVPFYALILLLPDRLGPGALFASFAVPLVPLLLFTAGLLPRLGLDIRPPPARKREA